MINKLINTTIALTLLTAATPAFGDPVFHTFKLDEPLPKEAVEISKEKDGFLFNGKRSYSYLHPEKFPNLGTSDFTISMWVYPSNDDDDIIGDLVSYTNPTTMHGLHISIDTRAGMCANQTNYRNLFFGISGGDTSPKPWRDEGRPGNAVFINSMAVFDGDLYVGTLERSKIGGRVYRYLESGKWADMNLPPVSSTIKSLAEFDGELCAATGVYKWGSSLNLAQNEISQRDGGEVYCYSKVKGHWRHLGVADQVLLLSNQNEHFQSASLHSLTNYRGELLGAASYANGVYRYKGEKNWQYMGTPYHTGLKHPFVRVQSMMPFNGVLYASLNDTGGVSAYNGGTNWTNLGLHTYQNYSLAAYRGKLHAGTFDNGDVAYLNKGGGWGWFGRVESEDEIMAMTVYNGKFYVGTLPRGYIQRWDDAKGWTRITVLDETPGKIGSRDVHYVDGILKRVWTFAVYKGRLFAGTLPSGKVKSTMIGEAISYDRSLPKGWSHITAVRKGQSLKLFINGEEVASHQSRKKLDFTNTSRLVIGRGETDSYNGKLVDFRVYDHALTREAIAKLFSETKRDRLL